MAAQTLPLTQPKASLWSRMGNARRYIMITTVILVLMLIIVLIGSAENTVGDIVASFIATTITFATPLTLGALSGIYSDMGWQHLLSQIKKRSRRLATP